MAKKAAKSVSSRKSSNPTNNPSLTVNNDPNLVREIEVAKDIVHNEYLFRREMLSMYADKRRNIEKECGYPLTDEITAVDYRRLYQREPVAARVVELYPEECWQSTPTLYETEDDTVNTQFELDLAKLAKDISGQGGYFNGKEGNKIWETLELADKLSGIGHYGGIYIGLSDTDDPSKPAQLKPGTKENEVLFLRALDETELAITAIERDKANPRYGLPTEYEITIADSQTAAFRHREAHSETVKVHWTRVVHIGDGLQGNQAIGTPRMRPVYNRLYDLHKLYGGSAEMYWRGAFFGLSFESHPGAPTPNLSEEAKAAMRQQIDSYFQGLNRQLISPGLVTKTVAPQVVDPSKQIHAQLTAICILLACPMRILMGSEAGELASTMDIRTWDKRVRKRQHRHISPNIIAPFIDRLILLRALTEPKEYFSEWNNDSVLTEQEQAEVTQRRVGAMADYVEGNCLELISRKDFLMHELGYSAAEAELIIKQAKEGLTDKLEEEKERMKMRNEMTPEPTTPNGFGGGGSQQPINKGSRTQRRPNGQADQSPGIRRPLKPKGTAR